MEGELTSARVAVMKKDKEIDDLKAEVKDLQEKLETIMAKRGEDREKIREFEKTKIQLEQLLEYKAKITESQADLQKQLAQVLIIPLQALMLNLGLCVRTLVFIVL